MSPFFRSCRATCTAALLLATPSHAQVIPTGSPTADILLSQAIAEHRVFLTCSALDPQTHARIQTNWQRDVTAAAAILTAEGIPPEAIAAFQTAAAPAALMPAGDIPFAEVIPFCAANPDWQTNYVEMSLILLDLKLPKAFE